MREECSLFFLLSVLKGSSVLYGQKDEEDSSGIETRKIWMRNLNNAERKRGRNASQDQK